jgi:uncharacterized repeat protein (TIGR01451 family)
MSVETNTPPSRQALVVPPRGSNLPVVLGAVVSAGVGFAAVWAVGLGRSTLPRSPHPGIQPAVQHGEEVVADLPAGTPVAGSERPGGSRWGGGAADAAAVRPWPPVPERSSAADVGADGVQPASFAAPGRFMPPDTAPRPMRAFSGPRPDDLAPAAGAEPVATPEPEMLPPIGGGPGGGPGGGDARVDLPGADEQPDPRALAFGADTADTAVAGRAALNAAPESAPAEDPGTAGEDPPPDTVAEPPRDDPLAAAGVVASPAPPSPAPPSPAPDGPPPATDELLPSPAFVPPPSPPAAAVPAAPAFPSPPRPTAAAPAAVRAVSPFAAAPPLVPGAGAPPPAMPAASPFASPPPPALTTASPFAAPPADAEPLDPAAGQAAAAVGQGRPGPPQLDGLQSPQFALEKRGPREIQVGKAARYEILLRNVGSATASDVVLRDAIPYGSALVTTTPPASPGETPDALVWRLGEMPPGGQARVVVELMPQTEGEIGSVASVTFRADASIRSRATKPALAIECRDPAAVRIGQDASVTITVSNPGTGVATGVVVEGTLPDTVSHRSGRELEFDMGQLRPGESRSIDLVLGTTGPGVRSARIMARADGGIEAERAVRLEVTAPTLELGIDMPTRRYLQRPATCRISMVNAGTATARAVELAAQLPPGMRFVKANNAGWHDTRTNRVLWNLEELPPGETGTVQVVVMPVELGPQKLLAAARSADGPADQVTHVCEVEGVAAIAFEVTDSEDPIEVDGVTEYVVRVGNNGTQAASGVQLAATLLGDLELIDAKGPAGHRVENLAVFFEPLAKLAPAEEAVYRVRVKGRQAGNQRVQVQLTSADHPAPITKEETTRVYDDR